MSCSVDGCSSHSLKSGLCNRHYLRKWRHGSPTAGSTDKKAAQKMLDYLYGYDGDDCIKWPYATVNGYGQIRVNGKARLVTRLLCEFDNGPDPSGEHHAAHSCGNGHLGCSNRNHLRWATYQENRQDMVDHGRSNKGKSIHYKRLSKEQIQEIKTSDKSNRELAIKFGKTPTAIAYYRMEK